MTTAQRIYDHAQQLLTIAHRCADDRASAELRRIAHALLEIAYRDDEVIAAEPRAARAR